MLFFSFKRFSNANLDMYSANELNVSGSRERNLPFNSLYLDQVKLILFLKPSHALYFLSFLSSLWHSHKTNPIENFACKARRSVV